MDKDDAPLVIKIPTDTKVYADGQEIPIVWLGVAWVPFRVEKANKLYFCDLKLVCSANGRTYADKTRLRVRPGDVTVVDFEDIKALRKKERTVAYWNNSLGLIDDITRAAGDIENASQAAALFAMVVRELTGISVRGVDEDAVSAVEDLSAVYSKAERTIARNNSPLRILESTIRGHQGDPFGVLQEALSQNRAIDEAFENAVAKLKKTGKVLSSRYDTDLR